MFISYEYISAISPYLTFKIKDTDFTFIIELQSNFDNRNGVFDYLVLKEYLSRNLDIAKNAAALLLFTNKKESSSIEMAIRWQAKICATHIPNWDEILIKRDEYIQKMLLLQ